MKEENKALLETAIQQKLTNATNDCLETEVRDRELSDALEAIEVLVKVESGETDRFRIESDKENNEAKIAIETAKFELDESRTETELERDAIRLELEQRRVEIDGKKNGIESDKNKTESKKETIEGIIKIVEIVAAIAMIPLDFRCKTKFADIICNFEKTDVFSTMAGKSLSGLFRWKK